MEKSYVLKSKVNGLDAYFERLSINGCPLNDELRGAKRFSFVAASRMAAKLNAFLRQWDDFTEDWLYQVVAI